MQATPHLPHPRPHSSTHFHLSAETALLGTLYTRSRAQHRAQPFLRHLQHVLRLSRGVLRALGPKQGGVGDGGSAASGSSTPVPLGDPMLGKLVQKLIPALLAASLASNRILTLHHFVPLHTLLLASYARLLAVSLGLATALGLDTAPLIAFPSDAEVLQKFRAAQPEIPTGDGQMGHVETADALVGEPIERGVELGERVERAPAMVSASPKPKPAAVDRLSGKKRRKASSLEVDSIGGADPTPRADTKLASVDMDMDVDAARPKKVKRDRDGDAVPSPKKVKHVDNVSMDPSTMRKDTSDKKRKAKEGKEGERTTVDNDESAAPSDEGRGDKPRSTEDLPGADRADTPTAKPAKVKVADRPKTAEGKSSDKAKAKSKSKDKKKKKKDAMDDIFGF